MNILFLFPYPLGCAASQRFRFEQYLEILRSAGIDYTLQPFLSQRAWEKFYRKGFFLRKSYALIAGLARRIFILFTIRKYDFVFIHRESVPVGPPVFEWFISRVLKRRIVFDFDDAIWIANSSESNRFFAPLKAHSSFFPICRMAYRISAGNEYLVNSVRPFNSEVVLNPTTIDTENWHNRIAIHDAVIPVIGWTGSHSTNKYLDSIYGVISKLKNRAQFRFVVISDERPVAGNGLFDYVRWSRESEIEDLLRINIGIMPLTHDAWSEGKCGFKALQYMSLGIPALVSPVGVNETIVNDGVNGFVCRSDSEWELRILQLINNREELIRMGRMARRKVEDMYSVKSNKSNFLNLFT